MKNKFQDTKEYIDKCFDGILQTKEVMEVKTELAQNLDSKISAYMNQGMDFQEAYNKALDSLGDMDEFIIEFKPETKNIENGMSNDKSEKTEKEECPMDFSFNPNMLVPLSVLLYLGIGFIFNWKTFFWIIIPVTSILVHYWKKYAKTGSWDLSVFTALSPFVYLIVSFMFGAWDLTWIIIPVTAIIVMGFKKSPE